MFSSHDFDEGMAQFKHSSTPKVWHRLPRSQKGLLMLPITKEPRDRWLANDESLNTAVEEGLIVDSKVA